MKESLYEIHVAVAISRQIVVCSCTYKTVVTYVHVLLIFLLSPFFLALGLTEHIPLKLTVSLSTNQRLLDDVKIQMSLFEGVSSY